jgi:UDP-glucose 4-epimerase
MVIPRFVSQALEGKPLQVHGDGNQSRCFLHVKDVVAALIRLMEHPGAVGQVFNLGSQEEVTIDELANRVIRLTGSSSSIQRIPYEEAYEEGYEDMPRRVPDISKIRALVGFQPSMTLDQIIQSVVESLQSPRSVPVATRPRPKRTRTAVAPRT